MDINLKLRIEDSMHLFQESPCFKLSSLDDETKHLMWKNINSYPNVNIMCNVRFAIRNQIINTSRNIAIEISDYTIDSKRFYPRNKKVQEWTPVILI